MDPVRTARILSKMSALFSKKQYDLSHFVSKVRDFYDLIYVIPSNHDYEGRSLLLFFSIAAARGEPQAFEALWLRYQDHFTHQHFITVYQSAYSNPVSPLYYLAEAAANGNIAPFMHVFEKFKDSFSYEMFTAKHPSPSIIWLLAKAAEAGYTQPFEAFWKKFSSKFTVATLREESCKFKGMHQTTLWLLSKTLSSRPKLFKNVWDRFKKEIDPLDLKKKATPLKSKTGRSILWHISFAAFRYNSKASRAILVEMLAQTPHVFTEDDIHDDKDPGNSIAHFAAYAQWSVNLSPLIKARSAFFLRLSQLKENVLNDGKTISLEEWGEMSSLALRAQEAGYYNAFYELGKDLYQSGNVTYAYYSFREVPKESWHYDNVQEKSKYLPDYFYSSALKHAGEEKVEYLQLSLNSTLQLPIGTPDRPRLFNLIVFSLFNAHGCDLSFSDIHTFMPAPLKCVMNESISFPACLTLIKSAISEYKTVRSFNDKIHSLEKQMAKLKLENQNLGKDKEHLREMAIEHATCQKEFLKQYSRASGTLQASAQKRSRLARSQ